MPEIAVNYWFWLSLGLVLIIVEMIVPGVFFLWFGIGAFLTGIIAFVVKGLALKYLTAIFGVLSVIAVFVGRRFVKKTDEIKTGINDINSKYSGKIVKAKGSFENGMGRVYMGDSVWEAQCSSDVSDRQPLKVVLVRDSVLIVEPLDTAEKKGESGK